LTAVILTASTFDPRYTAFGQFIAGAFCIVWPDEVKIPEISDFRLTAVVESLADIAESARGM
jgi:hypothetical protein